VAHIWILSPIADWIGWLDLIIDSRMTITEPLYKNMGLKKLKRWLEETAGFAYLNLQEACPPLRQLPVDLAEGNLKALSLQALGQVLH
ncbi:hypothetical protein ACJX0J_028571, partial [Zea mays]